MFQLNNLIIWMTWNKTAADIKNQNCSANFRRANQILDNYSLKLNEKVNYCKTKPF
jgi:hypothetical protein